MSKNKEIYEALKAPFPEEAYTCDSSRGFDLTSLKAQYIVDRLNEVLGLGNWQLEGEYQNTVDDGVIYIGVLEAFVDNRAVRIPDTVGYSKSKKNVGDMYKSARTECLSKAASYLGVGDSMYKGLVAPPKSGTASKPRNSNRKRSKKTSEVEEEF